MLFAAFAAVLMILGAGDAIGQTTAQTTWRASGEAVTAAGSANATPTAAAAVPPATVPAATAASANEASARPAITRVTAGAGSLPNSHGQIWREYDISPYTLRVTSTNRPEQAIVDWILRETGYEIWHSEPLGILSATQRTLRVYHTPEVQTVVAEVVDRFVASQAETHTFGIQVVTLDSPNWRERAQRSLQPVAVQAQGVQAWLLTREDAALLIADLRRRSDYREHSSPHLMVNNGQSTVVSATRGRTYIRSVRSRPEAWPGYEPQTATLDEGFALELSPLLSLNGQTIDAAIKCDIDQVEKLVPVVMDVSSAVAPRQRAKIEVPQLSHFRFHERFRWPVDQVLLVGMGVVPLPMPSDGKSVLPGLSLPLPSGPPRAEMLVFLESKGKSGQNARVTRGSLPEARTYQGRY